MLNIASAVQKLQSEQIDMTENISCPYTRMVINEVSFKRGEIKVIFL